MATNHRQIWQHATGREEFRPRLIQRLRRPGPVGRLDLAKFQGIGEGDKLSEVRRHFFDYDYMGASEFERGAIPKAFSKFYGLASTGQIAERVMDVRFHHQFSQYVDFGTPKEEYKTFDVIGDRPVYLLAPQGIIDDAEVWLHLLADSRQNISLKGLSYFDEAALHGDIKAAMRQVEEVERPKIGKPVRDPYVGGENVGGWFDLDHLFFFFIDKDMFDGTKMMFGLDRPVPQPQAQAAPAPAGAR